MGARTIDAQFQRPVPMDPAYDQFGGRGDVYGTGPYAAAAPYTGGSQIQGLELAPVSARSRDPMGLTRQSGLSDKSYQRFTETGPGGARAFGIDPENGISPRRLTDCVCVVIFGIYLIGMILLLVVTKNRMVGDRPYGDPARLNHGFDSAGRLCGVDADVEDKKFLFWCRDEPEKTGVPDGLNLNNPSCVASCPSETSKNIACLFMGQTVQQTIPGGQFGNVQTFHAQSQQSIMDTAPYDTEPFGGFYCMPKNETLKAFVQDGDGTFEGPLNWRVRLVHKIGVFENAWGVLFLSSLLAVALGYVYVLLIIKDLAKPVVWGTIGICYVVCLLASLFFFYGAFYEVPFLSDHLPFAWYKEANPIYTRATGMTATIASVVLATIFLFSSCSLLCLTTHLGGVELWDLVELTGEVITAMKVMLIPPAIEALWKYILMWILCYNSRILFTVGWVDDHRIVINGEAYKGLSARFHYDWWMAPWIVLYFYGAVWILELCNAFGQFLTSFAVISWYFMKKEGDRKTGVPPLPTCHATFDGLVYHAGSICLGAAIVPWTRVIRMVDWMVKENIPEEPQDDQHENCVVRCVRTTLESLDKCASKLKCWCNSEDGCSYWYTKDAYCDIIIRSQHFLQASEHSFSTFKTHEGCDKNHGRCRPVAVIGVMTIGAVCAFFTHVMIMTGSWYNDPTSSSFIDDPLAVDVLAFILCGNIAYGFMMLCDHTADTLLYCYAHNRKFNRKSVEKFIPDLLRQVVGDDDDARRDYKLYGAAPKSMYLSSWLPTKKKNKPGPGEFDSQAAFMGSALQSGGALDSQGYYRGPAAGTAAALTAGESTKYAPLSNPGMSLGYGQYDGGH